MNIPCSETFHIYWIWACFMANFHGNVSFSRFWYSFRFVFTAIKRLTSSDNWPCHSFKPNTAQGKQNKSPIHIGHWVFILISLWFMVVFFLIYYSFSTVPCVGFRPCYVLDFLYVMFILELLSWRVLDASDMYTSIFSQAVSICWMAIYGFCRSYALVSHLVIDIYFI